MAGSALAKAPPSRWLSWSAPPECQDTAEVERRMRGLLGRIQFRRE